MSLRNLAGRFKFDHRLHREHLGRYTLQCGLAAAAVLALLLILDAMTQTVLIAALGSSAFIAFAVPKSLNSDTRHMVGGYLVGMFAGGLMGTLDASLQFASAATTHAVMVVFAALATGLAMFIMVITKTEHPPAAALALGLVLNEWDLQTLLVVFGGVVALSLVKRLVSPLLTDLL